MNEHCRTLCHTGRYFNWGATSLMALLLENKLLILLTDGSLGRNLPSSDRNLNRSDRNMRRERSGPNKVN